MTVGKSGGVSGVRAGMGFGRVAIGAVLTGETTGVSGRLKTGCDEENHGRVATLVRPCVGVAEPMWTTMSAHGAHRLERGNHRSAALASSSPSSANSAPTAATPYSICFWSIPCSMSTPTP